nr:ribonuclease H-like domain, reverse transcriptase, RNA-dependent DNA polymerase [Tanacetum cinerariifolium]
LSVIPTGRVVSPGIACDFSKYHLGFHHYKKKPRLKKKEVKIYLEWDQQVVSEPGSDNESHDASVHNETTNAQQQPNIQPQIITTVSNNNAKFPYLKNDEYESKLEGLHKGYDKMQKILSQLNQHKPKPEDEDINLKFLRALPSSWSQDAGDAGEFALMGVTSENKVNNQNQFVPQAVLLRTGKVNIPPARPQQVPTGKPKVFAPVPAGRQSRPFPVPTDRGYSLLVSSDWWKSNARPMPHFSRPTSSYCLPYTPYVPTMSYNHMKYGRDRWATHVNPSVGCFRNHIKKVYTGYPRTIMDLIHLHTDDNVADLLIKALDGPSASIPSGVSRVLTGSYANFPSG